MEDKQTKEPASKNHHIKHKFDELLSQHQAEVDILKEEHTLLKSTIFEVLAERQYSSFQPISENDLMPVKPALMDEANEYNLRNDALNIFRRQIYCLEKENMDLRRLYQCSRKAILALETELKNYRDHFNYDEHKHESNTIKILENIINIQKAEFCKLASSFTNTSHKNKQLDGLKKVAPSTEKQQQFNDILETKLNQCYGKTQYLEKYIKNSKRIIKKQLKQEEDTIRNINQVLKIAYAAIREKETAQFREQVMKEECDYLASTMGGLMDDTAQKNAKNMKALQKKVMERNNVITHLRNQLMDETNNRMKFYKVLHVQHYENYQNYRWSIAESKCMLQELQINRNLLEFLKLKLEIMGKFRTDSSNDNHQHHTDQL